jgi:hypothetical protein
MIGIADPGLGQERPTAVNHDSQENQQQCIEKGSDLTPAAPHGTRQP